MNDIIDKARKLLRLRDRAGTPGEAQAAARALALLLEKHRITIAELEMRDAAVSEAMTNDSDPLLTYARMSRWRRRLIGLLCKHYGVAHWRHSQRTGRNRRGRYRFKYAIHLCGRPSDISMVRYMFSWLGAEAERLASGECIGQGFVAHNSWRDGFIVGIGNQLADAQKSVSKDHSEAALTLHKRHDVAREFLSAAVGGLVYTKVHSRLSHDADAHAAGKKRGEAQHLGDKLAGNDAGNLRALPAAASS